MLRRTALALVTAFSITLVPTPWARVAPAAANRAVASGVASAPSAPAAVAPDCPTDLFFSEYIEGTSFNKALELYNGTGAPLAMSGAYTMALYSNGAAAPSVTQSLTATIAAGDVYVLAHAGATTTITSTADLLNSSLINFNGNDAIGLYHDGVLLDAIGQIGFDPVTEWGTGNVSTADNTIVRQGAITAGDGYGGDAFDPATEWDGYAVNTFSYLGWHSLMACDYVQVAKSGPATAEAGSAISYDLTVGNSGSQTATGTVVTDSLPAEVSFITYTTAVPVTFTQPAAQTLVWDLGDLAPATVGLTITVQGVITGTALVGATFTNTLEATTTQAELALANNRAEAVTLIRATDGYVTKSGPATVYIGETVTYTVGYGNLGSQSASFTLTDTLPAGFEAADIVADTSGVAPVDGANTRAWMVSNLAGGTSVTFTLALSVPGTIAAGTLFTNTVELATAEVGDDPGNNLTTAATTLVLNPCLQPYTPVYAIQGSGLGAAVTGTVATRGVVVGDFEGGTSVGLRGFYLQDADGDGDPATSDGIFVFNSSNNSVSAGDLVRVTGTASDFNGQTQVGAVTSIVKCGTGSVNPVDVSLPFTSLLDPERWEGMLVRLPQALVISEYFNYDRFGELALALPLTGEARAFAPTAIDEPGSAAQARALANSLRRITLDDGLGSQNPASLRHPNGSPFALDNRFRGGDTLQNTVGVLGYDFSLYRIQPTGPAIYTAANPRPDAPGPVGGTLRVAAQNTLNFFVTLDYATGNPLDNQCGPLQSVECRGADDATELTRQRDKLLAALVSLNADIVGLNELENTPGVDPLGDAISGLVTGLNAVLGAGTFAYIDTGVIGTDAIRVGLIYKPARVTPAGAFHLLTTAVDPRFLDTKSRPALAQTFEAVGTGERLTVVVNHFKSKGSACDDVGDPDLGDGQGNCNLTRTNAARALVDWLATDPTGSGDPDVLILGDLNSYAQEDPIDAVRAGADDTPGTGDDYSNVIAQHQGAYAYSYVFDGQAGYLDHALASASLAGQVTGASEWHINADEPDVLDYDTSFKPPEQDALYEPNGYRVSDHDTVVVGLDLAPAPANFSGSTKTVSAASVPAGSVVTYTLTVSNSGVLSGTFRLTDTLDANLTLVSAPGLTANGNTLTASGTLAGGAQRVLTIAVRVSPTFAGAIANTAELAGDGQVRALAAGALTVWLYLYLFPTIYR